MYQWCIRPLIGPSCRFWPTCSAYAIEALKIYPWYKALWLIGKRLLRCSCLSRGGVDPVPREESSAPVHTQDDQCEGD